MKTIIALLFVFVLSVSMNTVSAQKNKADSTYKIMFDTDSVTVKVGEAIDEVIFTPADSFKVEKTIVQKDKQGNPTDTIIKVKAHGKYFYSKKSDTQICYNADGTVSFSGTAADSELPTNTTAILVIIFSIFVLGFAFRYRKQLLSVK